MIASFAYQGLGLAYH